MARHTAKAWIGKVLFMGIDLHQAYWQITILSEEGLLVFAGRIASSWEALLVLLDRYQQARQIVAAYEVGYFGFWLADALRAYGAQVVVTPPTLIPSAVGNRVKTDRIDSLKLAGYLRKELLPEVYIPSPQERAHRQVCRRRRQLIRDRVSVQNQIKSLLQFYGIDLGGQPRGRWSVRYVENLHRFRFEDVYLQESFTSLLSQYDCISRLLEEQTDLLKKLSQEELYRDRVKILCSIPGVGWISAMELLLELQDVARFRRAEELAAYVGLTPSQYSSGERVRMGHITRQGKSSVRTVLIQVAWSAIRKDEGLRKQYEQIKARAGSKRAIVAIARKLLIRARHLLLTGEQYQMDLVAD